MGFSISVEIHESGFTAFSTIVPGAYSGLGAHYFNTKLTLIGRVTTDNTLTTKMKAVITDKLTVKAQTQLIDESRLFDTLVSFEYMALNYKAQFQLGSKGLTAATYIQVSLATDFVYNCFSRDVKASVGRDCEISRFWSRVQGKIDSNGVAYACLEKQLKMGLECVLSASLDHKNKDYRLGLGLAYGSPPLSSDDLQR
ncbi:hypothetical protein ARALYDRAFT_334303 [Arabidopsis lyrata subsp. lyrata]|uniref:Uncharacterized protein n=2 Tax=Arabidopsis lyrata subsp. lyrata TaxID=81972 RepID=D7KKM9_ARALL|nr:hypothetical protein ARALYDRAFT_334303 [Arabidopsis lyrata subsp. lyrata]